MNGNTWFKNERKETYHYRNAALQIDFILLDDRRWLKQVHNVKMFPGELQHSLVVMDVKSMSVKRK